ncbi:protein SON isoform X2 [Dunckerocampus dactyliophorus]|uniref:protein SON isoform X2 n=1 Tax=Dunckerocampus dactyliophorus TaxID=161453 RepID=UPI00240653D2|nr:protein SON isoform X2 [Dunckerocampus dactyliophorus]
MHTLKMAANIEQIFQDFILNKIREIEDQNVDTTAAHDSCSDMASGDNGDRQCDGRSSQKKHKKHKKHKSKKKKKKREKERKKSHSESGEELDAQTKPLYRKGPPTVNEQQSDDSSSRSHKHRTGKRKKKRHKDERRENSSDFDRTQRGMRRQREELPDIIPKDDGCSNSKTDERRKSHSRSHSNCSHSSVEKWTSRLDKRKFRSCSRSTSHNHSTRSRSLDNRDDLDRSTESKQNISKGIQLLSHSPKGGTTAELQRPDHSHSHKPAVTTRESSCRNDGPASRFSPIPSVESQPTGESIVPQLKASEHISATVRKSPAKMRHNSSKTQPRSKEGKSATRQKRSRSPHITHRTRARSRSSSRKKRSRSRSRGWKSRRSRSAPRGWQAIYRQRDRWKREPSHSPVLVLRKKRSLTRKRHAHASSPQRISELGKEQLLEIAKANAAAMCAKAGMSIPTSLRTSILPLALPNMAMNAAMASMTAATMTAALSNIGTLSSLLPLPTITNKPAGANLTQPINAAFEEVKKKVVKQANSISIKEFTDKCKMIVDSKGELPVAVPHVSVEDDDGKPCGGLLLREHKAISFNINNTTVRPAAAGMAKEFPVSSGSQHRKKESKTLNAYGDWVPVDKTLEEAQTAGLMVALSSLSATSETLKAAALPGLAEPLAVDGDSVFPDPPPQPVDISQAVSERIKAQRRLAENPHDVSAICMLSRAQEQVDLWAQSNTVPGLFTGSTGAQVLSTEELSNSGPQAWLKKDQFLKAAPVSGGVGEFLMRKMGWKTGEGLGRNREGTVEPIIIDFKVDRKGLVAEGEKPQKPTGGLVVTKDLMGKHPVSALIELCTKKRMTQPDFIMVHHSGPDHRKNFLFKVTVNGVDYQPQTASPNKKHAKAMAATVALQALGEVPVDGPGLYTGPVFTAASTGPLFST